VTAEAALAQALTEVDALAADSEYGFYTGLAGIAWTCREAGILLANERLAERGSAALLLAARLVPDRARVDLINGSAGLIPVLLEAAAANRCDEMLTAAVRHGEHLLNLAERREQGWSWDTLGSADEPHLLGFAHGASGIAHALATLARATDRSDFLAGVRGALRYETSLFRPEEDNWPDLRSFVQPPNGGKPPCMVAWCHGAAGIGIARLALHKLLPNERAIPGDAEIAIRTTAPTLEPPLSQKGGNSSLCHGDAGNADLLILADDLLDRPELRQQAEAAGIRALEQFEESNSPWPCGIWGERETPSLFLGLAGIGYFFLRLYDSEAVPTVLLPAQGAKG
jgi:lantibiotic modifying enzyme